MPQLPVLVRRLAWISLNSVLTTLENIVKCNRRDLEMVAPIARPLQFHRQDFRWVTSLTCDKIWATKSYPPFCKEQGTVHLRRGSYRQLQAATCVSSRWKKCPYQFPFHTARNYSPAVIKLYSRSTELLKKYYLTLEKTWYLNSVWHYFIYHNKRSFPLNQIKHKSATGCL